MGRPEAGAYSMAYDIAFRFQQALDPSGLSTLPACLHALTTAIKDCRNAGKSDDLDPPVILLARHLGAVARDLGENDSLLRSEEHTSELKSLLRTSYAVYCL